MNTELFVLLLWPFAGIIITSLMVWCLMDTLRHQYHLGWIWLILILPIGPILYLLNFKMMPMMGLSPIHERLSRRLRINTLRAEEDPRNRRELVGLLQDEGLWEESLKLLREFLDNDPTDLSAQWMAAKALLNTGRDDGAVQVLDYVVESQADFASGRALNLKGEALMRLKRFEEAERDFRVGLKGADRLLAQVNLASLLLDSGRADEAKTLLDEVMKESRGFKRREDRAIIASVRRLKARLPRND